MRDAINNFAKQFDWEPKIQGRAAPSNFGKFIVAGMGGSHLAAGLLKARDPGLDIIVYSDYGLPRLSSQNLTQRLIIISSYSGNTEEAIDAFKSAQSRQLSTIAITTGGKLIELAQKSHIPYIQMPRTGIQPRMALGFSIKAMARAMGQDKLLAELSELSGLITPANLESPGRELAARLKGKIPIIYTSTRNQAIAYNWKIKFNETGKIPSFYNVLPELNHNEMTGFDVKNATRDLSQNFYFILLQDADDHPKIQKRMQILQKLYQDRGLAVEIIDLKGQTRFHKMFSSLILADWTAYYTAKDYGLEPEQVPMVEEFKKDLC
jgi:glucose/mannose-6-phosphate isomerase